MGSEEERVLENQLEIQLQEQKDLLSALGDALAVDPSNLELLSVQEELVQAIKDAEDGLLHLKRARLLREVDAGLHDSNSTAQNVKVEPLDQTDFKPEPLEEQSYSVGSKCRFRYIDGLWYNGEVVRFEDSDTAKISFLTPTAEKMLEGEATTEEAKKSNHVMRKLDKRQQTRKHVLKNNLAVDIY
ncbi:hypothetical protein K2173_017444 [Erythroxylum novogranatense]|uniref:Tudor domain-containing protein n=1 Tax=Erythroxylum novogranatense TaxID=1862640 RepID=A0AAV8TN78_9ROSI|nr:hypothetical protein K2173_017444 [Erythroxylum novogranatense]